MSQPKKSKPLAQGTKQTDAGQTANVRGVLVIRNVVIGLIGLLGVGLLFRLILLRNFDYDEISHMHMTWLVSVGEVPYRDFAANHFPFLWILLSPLMRILPESTAALSVLRVVALLLNLTFVGCLVAMTCREQPAKQWVWAMACFALVVFCPPVMHFLMEFRPDPLSNTLLFSAIAWLYLGGSRKVLTGLVCGFCIGAATLVNTKYLLFPWILGLTALVVHARQLRQHWRFALALLLGFGFALLCGVSVMLLKHISLTEGWRMVVAYNAAVEKDHPFGFGLARIMTRYFRLELIYVVAGLVVWVVMLIRERRPPGVLAAAIFIFLLFSYVTTARPWKQYISSWLLLAAYFPARSLPPLLARLGAKTQVAAALVFVGAALFGFLRTGIWYPLGHGIDRATQDRAINWLCHVIPPDGYLVCSYYIHPVFRRDTFFKTVTDDAGRTGDGLERFMPELSPHLAEHFRQSGYEKELLIRPPTVIVMQNYAYTSAQAQAFKDYLGQHAKEYVEQKIPGTEIFVLVRKGATAEQPAGAEPK